MTNAAIIKKLEAAAKMPANEVAGGWHLSDSFLDLAEAALGRDAVIGMLRQAGFQETDKGIVVSR